MTIAILCSGQSTQHAAMFALTGDAPEASAVFAAAEGALGCDPRTFVQKGESVELNANLTGQILCVTQALAGFTALSGSIPAGGRMIIGGYSVGELAAWGCAGRFDPAATIELARERARLMDEASGPDDGLAFVRGLARDRLEALCARHGCAIAIVNPGALFVVGGRRSDLRALCDEALARGAAKSGPLQVQVASHTPRLGVASVGFRQKLAARPVARGTAGVRLLSGIDAAPVVSVERGLDTLAAQISQTIDWAACLEACVEAGADAFLELGPGRALAAMASETYPHIAARSLEDFRGLDGVRSWLAREAL